MQHLRKSLLRLQGVSASKLAGLSTPVIRTYVSLRQLSYCFQCDGNAEKSNRFPFRGIIGQVSKAAEICTNISQCHCLVYSSISF